MSTYPEPGITARKKGKLQGVLEGYGGGQYVLKQTRWQSVSHQKRVREMLPSNHVKARD
jgi:hypothetical protein